MIYTENGLCLNLFSRLIDEVLSGVQPRGFVVHGGGILAPFWNDEGFPV